MTDKFVLAEKLREAVASVLPIAVIVAVVCFFLVPVTTDLMLSFLIGTALLIIAFKLWSSFAAAK